jgi:hypothetical protein
LLTDFNKSVSYEVVHIMLRDLLTQKCVDKKSY